MNPGIHIGTCSWKFPSWRGLVYSDVASPNYLQEYARQFDTVEIDQWFWSLFGPDKVVLPQPKVVAEYAASVPDSFRFGIKMPNALTMSHFHQEAKSRLHHGQTGTTPGPADPLVPNPHFLSLEILHRMLDRLEPMRNKLGPLIFQFGYLNKQMIASQAEFLDKLGSFVAQLPSGYVWAIESRNPNHLNDRHFKFLQEHGLAQVWEMGYYMPPVLPLYHVYTDQLTDNVVIRLHGPDRKGMEGRTGKDWSKIIEPHDAEVNAVVDMLRDVAKKSRKAWAFVNNHFEGCAPLTLRRIEERLAP